MNFFISFFVFIVFLSNLSLPNKAWGAERADFSLIPILKGQEEISSVSPNQDAPLAKDYPLYPARLKIFMPSYDWKELGLVEFDFTYYPNKQQAKVYENLIERINSLIEKHDPSLKINHYFFKANLLHALSNMESGREDSPLALEARNAYIDALSNFPESSESLLGTYHLCVLLIKLKEYREATLLVNRQEEKWTPIKEWSVAFRTVLMESYFLRKRFIRAEDFFWVVSSKINEEDLTADFALRYGDCLFMQQQFSKAVEWYKHAERFLDSKESSIVPYSKLYYAEALFQIGESEQALKIFKEIQEAPFHQSVKDYIEYHILQMELKNTGQLALYEDKFRDFHPVAPSSNLEKALAVQSARLVLKLGLEKYYPDSIEKMEKILTKEGSENYREEALFLQSLLRWKSNQKEVVYETWKNLAHSHSFQDAKDKLVSEMSEQIVNLLLKESEGYRENGEYTRLLSLLDSLEPIVEIAPATENKIKLLLAAANAYTEIEMITSSSRLLQRMLFEYDLSPDLKVELALELGRNYALLGEFDLLAQILSYVHDIPSQERSQKLYLLNQAALALSEGNYLQCSQSFDHLLKIKLSAYELYKYAIQGTSCARYAGSLAQAERFLSLLPTDPSIWDETTPETNPTSVSRLLEALQKRAYFEKLSLQVDQNHSAETLAEYEKLKPKIRLEDIPLDTIFQLLRAYQKNGQNDQAMELWKNYSDKTQGDWAKILNPEYPQLLNFFGDLELIPRA
ncbi:MAG: hypothetical protein HQM15_06075 [Deltaproteobacteria bacterium]|nr:hypothetical protein [Deltaproteobacteria bacterium]